MSSQLYFLNSVPYLFFLFVLIFLFFKEGGNINEKKTNFNIRFFTIVLFLFFIGLRGHIYSDWYSYYPKFENLPTLWNGNIIKELSTGEMEPGFIFYSILIKSFFPNYFVWVFINTGIDLWVLDKVFKTQAKYYVLAFIVFFVMNGLFIEFNLYRNSKSIILFLLSLQYLKNRKFIPYFFINLLGITFHFSAILFIPLYFILNKDIPRFIVWSIFIISNIVFIFHVKWINFILGDLLTLINISMISDKMALHSDFSTEVVFSIGYLERIFSFVFFTIYYHRLVEKNSMNRIFYNVYLIYFIFILNFSEISVFSERFSVLFVFSYWILYPNIYSLIKSKQNKYIFLILFFTFGFLRTYQGNANSLAKYDNLLWGIDSYDVRKTEFEQFSAD
ncbi:EpsG family protein [Flavobacterium ajazii]|uniref:EpsG family protein n=1 Tax=Flavobacterium ajazii TaxID=2692318 RepID=UPI0013D76CC2|nr:EpsG family protein [Flavobacterium ajazii]